MNHAGDSDEESRQNASSNVSRGNHQAQLSSSAAPSSSVSASKLSHVPNDSDMKKTKQAVALP